MAKTGKPASWNELLSILNGHEDTVKAAKALSKMATSAHVDDLYSLLQSDHYFVREAAAIPLARLEKEKSLAPLLSALQRGEQEGHDNDGLTNTIIGLLESRKKIVTPILLSMLKSSHQGTRADAVWALGFVTSQVEPSVFFEIIRNERDSEVRAMASDALLGYLGKKQKVAPDTKAFLGKWMWLDCTAALQFGFEIEGAVGRCVKTNAPTYAIGDIMMKIELCSDQIFVGTQIFTNGAWYPVTAIREGGNLYLQGGGVNWRMDRID